jgi:pyruvate carboxylase subunit A
MGDKIQARNAMIAAGIPVIPGSDHNLENVEEARVLANKIGYPVMLQATNGGGGRGIRRCDSEKDLLTNYERVISEASKAFGKPEVFLEKCVVNPKHIEVQVLGDSHGNAIHLFERDCSIQRRNQKLVEIAPARNSPRRSGNTSAPAVRAAKAVGYVNAARWNSRSTRQPVLLHGNEHPAAGRAPHHRDHHRRRYRAGADLHRRWPPLQQQDGIGTAATPLNSGSTPRTRRTSLPQPAASRLLFARRPRRAGRRGDSHRLRIPPYFDSMRRPVWNLNWEATIARGRRALDDMLVYGVKTTIPYYQEILKNPEFRSGRFNTSFVDEHPELTQYTEKKPPEVIAAAIAAAIAAHQGL